MFTKGNTERMNQKTMKFSTYKFQGGGGQHELNRKEDGPCRVYLCVYFKVERSEETASRGSHCPNVGQLGHQFKGTVKSYFKGLDPADRVPEELWTEVSNTA